MLANIHQNVTSNSNRQQGEHNDVKHVAVAAHTAKRHGVHKCWGTLLLTTLALHRRSSNRSTWRRNYSIGCAIIDAMRDVVGSNGSGRFACGVVRGVVCGAGSAFLRDGMAHRSPVLVYSGSSDCHAPTRARTSMAWVCAGFGGTFARQRMSCPPDVDAWRTLRSVGVQHSERMRNGGTHASRNDGGESRGVVCGVLLSSISKKKDTWGSQCSDLRVQRMHVARHILRRTLWKAAVLQTLSSKLAVPMRI